MLKTVTAALSVLLVLTGLAYAHSFQAGTIVIEHPWSPPAPQSASVASGYLTLSNRGTETDRLMEVSSEAFASAEIHRTLVEGGVASMRPVEGGVAVEPGATVDFETEKLHVMFMEPKAKLEEGARFKARLVFEKAGAVEVDFVVERKAQEAMPQDHTMHGKTN